MFNQAFNHDTIRKYIIFFGTLFNDTYLLRDDNSSDGHQKLKVPLNYGNKEKFLARLEGNPDLEKSVAIQLPRMSFELNNFVYDSSRKLPSTGRIRQSISTDPSKFQFQYNPVPYNLNFSLYVMVKNAEDGTRIIEQILPYFTPEYTGTLNLNQDLGEAYDIPLILNSVQNSDSYEGDFIQRRAIIWTLNFTLRGWIFGPTRTSENIIKQVEINIHHPNEAENVNSSAIDIKVRPGLTEDGDPTSNSDLSIDKNLISSDDNYGFIRDLQEDL